MAVNIKTEPLVEPATCTAPLCFGKAVALWFGRPRCARCIAVASKAANDPWHFA